MNIIDAAYHRNGVSGVGFRVALVEDPFNNPETVGRIFVVIQFDDEKTAWPSTAVLALDDLTKFNVDQAWRGDHAEHACGDAIRAKVNEKHKALMERCMSR